MSSTRKSDSSRSSASSAIPPENLIALPSLSCALSSLPQATSLDGISLHPSALAQRAAESEAKLRKALSKTASHGVPAAYVPPSTQYSPDSPALTIRKPTKQKLHA